MKIQEIQQCFDHFEHIYVNSDRFLEFVPFEAEGDEATVFKNETPLANVLKTTTADAIAKKESGQEEDGSAAVPGPAAEAANGPAVIKLTLVVANVPNADWKQRNWEYDRKRHKR